MPAAIRSSIMVEWPIVPAMTTTFADEASAYAGPGKLEVPVVEY